MIRVEAALSTFLPSGNSYGISGNYGYPVIKITDTQNPNWSYWVDSKGNWGAWEGGAIVGPNYHYKGVTGVTHFPRPIKSSLGYVPSIRGFHTWDEDDWYWAKNVMKQIRVQIEGGFPVMKVFKGRTSAKELYEAEQTLWSLA